MFKFVREVMGTVETWWTRIRQSGNAERRRELTDAQAWAAQALDGVHTEQNRVREEFAELEAAWFAGRPIDMARKPREYYYHSLAASYCNRAGWCVTALEAVFAGGLSILLLALPWVAGAAVGIVMTFLLAVGLKGVIAPLVVGRFADRPKAGRDVVLRLLIITGPIALCLLAVVFVVRGVAGWLGVWLFPWATGGLAVLCPVVAAALFVLAGLYGWSRRLTEQYRALEQAQRDLMELSEHCLRSLAGLPAAAPLARSVDPSGLAKVGATVLLVSCMLANTGCSGPTQASNQAATTLVATGTDAPDATIGELWIDDTVSVDDRDRPRATRAVQGALLDLSRRHHVARWDIYGFGEEPWREVAFHQMAVPRWQAPECAPPTEASRIFKVHQNDPECRDQVRAAELAYHRQVEQQLGEMLRVMGSQQPRIARCTNLGDLLLRVSQAPRRRLVLIVSDGAETCRPAGLPRVPAPASDSRVAFLLIGSTPQVRSATSTLGEQFHSRRQALLRVAPWLRVVAPWELNSSLFESAEPK